MTSLLLQATGLTKRLPGVLANDHINFSLERGEIHALLTVDWVPMEID
jgi:simple sugar transport system ATP-binding protein